MRNFLLTFLSLSIVFFTGCASKSGTLIEKSGLEGTKVNTYYLGEYIDKKMAQDKLEAAGFEVLVSYASVKKGTTLVFTNEDLKKEGAKPGRAYVAVSRLFIDEKEKMISFTNPVYFGRAFMQDEYNHTVFNGVLEKIMNAFPNLKPSVDVLDYDALSGYQFMMSMPYYNDQDMLGDLSASTTDSVNKAMGYKKGKSVLFELKLSQNSTLLGYDLGKRTKKFVKKIGRANAAILPWCVSIENGQAKALNAKYYIAISYPLLDMSGFMGIATVPGAITKDLEKAFKK